MKPSPAPTRLRLATAPPLARGSMTPVPWAGVAALFRGGGTAPARPAARSGWALAAATRRRLLLALVLACAALATAVLEGAAPAEGRGAGAGLQTGLFALLFAWVSAGCVTAVMGYWSLRHGDRHALAPEQVAGHRIDASARTAIVMPICNEDIATVVAGLRATWESLAAAQREAGAPDVFDVYILSDTNQPALRDAEVAAWQRLRDELAAEGGTAPRIYYRWRQRRTRRKAGNVMDFCRRWGRDYRYMVVFDADSVMSGEALLTLVRLMEARPRAGIIQTAPRSCGHDSLHARVQQFAGRVTGPLFAAGLRYWQLGESHYWGHNAILRVEPFMRHCALAKLPGAGGLSGEILSHDFVEAALMRRAGYEVWLLPELDGSYEQAPPHLVDELTRDRRWCQGNLQNARLIAEPGLAGVHRAMFVTGAMSYVASPLWLAFVLLGVLPWLLPGAEPGALLARAADGAALPLAAVLLWLATLALLFVPRVLAVRLVLARGAQDAFGGQARLIASAALEALLSALQAPVRMVAHSLFVLGALTGLQLHWKSPSREAAALGWREAAARFGLTGALVAGVSAWWLAGQPADAWRVLPLALPLVLAVPLAVSTSRPSLGMAWRRRGWLLIPEETRPPEVLRAAWRYAGKAVRPALAAGGAAPPAPLGRPLRLPSPGLQRTAGWPRRSLAAVALTAAGVAALLPRDLASGGLSPSDLAALRIVMLASSPDAAPRVLERPAQLRLSRAGGGEPRRVRRAAYGPG